MHCALGGVAGKVSAASTEMVASTAIRPSPQELVCKPSVLHMRMSNRSVLFLPVRRSLAESMPRLIKDVGLDSCESKQAHMLEGSWERQGDRQSQPRSRQGIRTHRCMKLLSRLFSSNSGATNVSLFFDWARVQEAPTSAAAAALCAMKGHCDRQRCIKGHTSKQTDFSTSPGTLGRPLIFLAHPADLRFVQLSGQKASPDWGHFWVSLHTRYEVGCAESHGPMGHA